MRFARRPLSVGVHVAVVGALVAGCNAQAFPPGCAKVPVEAILHVEPDDPRQVWATDLRTGAMLAVEPRAELGWRVDPDSDPGRLLDAQGKVATFEGEIFRQACVDAATNTLLIGPEDMPDPDRPPN